MSRPHLASYLIDAASTYGGRPACRDGAGTHSYDDYLRESLRVAALLRGSGVAAGDRVCISAPKSFSLYAGVFGTLMLDACYVPIDYTAPAERARRIIADCAPAAVITTSRNLERLFGAPSSEGKGGNDHLVIGRLEAAAPGEAKLGRHGAVLASNEFGEALPRPDSLDPSRPAYILYTSGSTGEPRGVVHTHDSAAAFVEWAVDALRVGSDDIVPQIASVSFDLSVFDIFGAVRAGALLVPIHESAILSLVRFCRAVAAAGATVLYCVPSLLLREARSQELGWRELERSPLRHVVFAGEPINKQALRRLRPFIRSVGLNNWYGPTETNVCCFHRISDDDIAEDGSIPIGKACPYASLSFVWDSPEAGTSGAGELLVAGSSVMTGYWNREAAISRAMQDDGNGTKYYRTGDFVRLNGRGDLIFLGRRDRQVKVRGYRVQLDEVEATLQKHLPDAEIACALIKPDGADPILVAAIARGRTLEGGEDIRTVASSDLPLYMVPEKVFVLDALPRNERGKIDYAALASWLAAEYLERADADY